MGKFIFTIPAKPFMGKILCAFRDSWGNLFFPTPGFAGRGEKSHPYFSSSWDWASPSILLISHSSFIFAATLFKQARAAIEFQCHFQKRKNYWNRTTRSKVMKNFWFYSLSIPHVCGIDYAELILCYVNSALSIPHGQFRIVNSA